MQIIMRIFSNMTTDIYSNSFDFKSNGGSGVYEYDGNGSLSVDPYKGFAFEYDLLGNLKRTESEYTTSYVYSSTGERLSVKSKFNGCIIKQHPVFPSDWEEDGVVFNSTSDDSGDSDIMDRWKKAGVPRDTEFCGPFIFEYSVLDKFLFDGGYCTFKDGEASFHYYLQDHLGNNRAVVSEDGTVEQTTEYYPFGGIYGDVSTNPGLQLYKYNGKEFDHSLSLDLYDYGARLYDPALVVWTGVDPLAEKYGDFSPYVYCHNNPVNMTDPDGKDDLFDENGNFLVRTKYGTSVMIKSGEGYIKITNVDFSNNQKIIENIGRHYLAKSDKGNFSLRVSDVDEDVPRGVAFSHSIGTDNYDLYLTDGYVNPSLGDYNDFECITYHESVHRNNANAGDTPNGEIEAIIQTTRCDAWHNATNNYIWSQAAYAANNLNNIKKNPNFNNYLRRLNAAFTGYATFGYSNNEIQVINQLQDALCIGKLRK